MFSTQMFSTRDNDLKHPRPVKACFDLREP
jgi:hypothetical protein